MLKEKKVKNLKSFMGWEFFPTWDNKIFIFP